MNPPDHFHTMSDEQLAAWHTMQQTIDRLTRRLGEEIAAREAAQDLVREGRDRHTHEMNTRADTILDLAQKHANQQNAVRRSAAALVITLRALQSLHDALMMPSMQPEQSKWPGEVFRALGEASEVIRAYGIPF